MIANIKKTIVRFVKHPTFLSFYLPSFLVAFAWGIRSPILPLYGSELSGVYLLIGLISAGGGLGTMIMDLPIGHFIQNIDKRNTMIAGIAMDALSTLALVWVDSIWVAIGLRIIGGMGHAVFSIARHTYITDAIGVNARGRAISLLGGILRTGLFMGPAVGGKIGAEFGIRLPFAAYALISFVAMSVLLFAKNQTTEEVENQEVPNKTTVSLREALQGRLGIFMIASLSYILGQIAIAAESLIIPLWSSEILTLSNEPNLEGMPVYYEHDVEGIKAEKSILIENGKLQNFIADRTTAPKINSKPTGCTRALDARHPPMLEFSNIIIKTGGYSLPELIEDISEGLYVTNLAGASTVGNKSMITSESGFIIKNGELTDQVDQVSFSFDVSEDLHKIDAIGGDFAPNCIHNYSGSNYSLIGTGTPHLRFSSLEVK